MSDFSRYDPVEFIDACLNCTRPPEECNGECFGNVAGTRRGRATDEFEQQLLHLMKVEKMDNGEIAKILGLSRYQVQQFRRENKIPNAAEMRMPRPEQVDGMRKLNYSWATIGNYFHVSQSTAWRIWREAYGK